MYAAMEETISHAPGLGCMLLIFLLTEWENPLFAQLHMPVGYFRGRCNDGYKSQD